MTLRTVAGLRSSPVSLAQCARADRLPLADIALDECLEKMLRALADLTLSGLEPVAGGCAFPGAHDVLSWIKVRTAFVNDI
jgi:hypothetical protein